MSFPKIGPPPSRLSKRQITAYLQPHLYDVVRKKVEEEGNTLQLYLGRALNAELHSRGIDPVFSEIKMRSFVRRKGAAQLRSTNEIATTRKGRRIVAGWFERNEVERFTLLSIELGVSAQAMAEAGFEKLLAGYVIPDQIAA